MLGSAFLHAVAGVFKFFEHKEPVHNVWETAVIQVIVGLIFFIIDSRKK
jgi:hypothetical protein